MNFIERIQPNRRNVLRFQNVLLDDYRRIGVPEDAAEQIVFGHDGRVSSELLGAMQDGPKRYQALSSEIGFAAVASVDDFNYGNMKPFVSTVEYIEARLLHKTAQIRGENPAQHDGLFSFGVAQKYDYDSTANEILDHILEGVAAREKKGLRATIDAEDADLLTVFESRGRQVVNKLGKVTIRGVTREYYLYEIDAPEIK